jgi:hypothetical protein
MLKIELVTLQVAASVVYAPIPFTFKVQLQKKFGRLKPTILPKQENIGDQSECLV